MRRRVVCPRSHPASLYVRRPPASFPSARSAPNFSVALCSGVFIPSPPARSICPRGPPHHRCAPVRRHLRRLGGGTVRPPLALAAAREATACWRTPAGACVRVCLPRRNRWRVPGSLLRSGLLGIAQPLACSRQPLRSRLLANAQPLMCLSLRALDRGCVPDFRRRSGRGPFMVGDLLLLSGLSQNRLTWPGVAFLLVHDLLR
jgi:hypothetical protein